MLNDRFRIILFGLVYRLKENASKYEYLAAFSLIPLHFVSAGTTYRGISHILAAQTAFIAMLTIQFMLLMASAGMVFSRRPATRICTIVLFGAISVYSSVFSYQSALTGEKSSYRYRAEAELAHLRHRRGIYIPLIERRVSLQAGLSHDSKTAERERKGTFGTGKGVGVRYKKIMQEVVVKEKELGALERKIALLKPYFPENISTVSTEDLFAMDTKSWAAAQSVLPPPQQSDYMTSKTRVRFTEPYHQITSRDPDALVALLLALIIDAFMILLGLSFKKDGDSRLRSAGNFIRDTRESWDYFAKTSKADLGEHHCAGLTDRHKNLVDRIKKILDERNRIDAQARARFWSAACSMLSGKKFGKGDLKELDVDLLCFMFDQFEGVTLKKKGKSGPKGGNIKMLKMKLEEPALQYKNALTDVFLEHSCEAESLVKR